MKARAIAALAVLAFTAALAPLSATLAATDTTARYDLATRLWQPEFGGQYEGRLRLRVSSDGIVNGYFMDSSGRTTDVTGGLTGTKIWLQLNNRTVRQQTFVGTFVDGIIEAKAPGNLLNPWKLEAKPSKL
jgi:hypothetical protein